MCTYGGKVDHNVYKGQKKKGASKYSLFCVRNTWMGPDLQNILKLTSQWLNFSCGLASPLVRFRISSLRPKLSATGRRAVMLKMDVPSFKSSYKTRPFLFASTAYIFPKAKQKIDMIDAQWE